MKEITTIVIKRYSGATFLAVDDVVAVEEPLEISLVFENNFLKRKSVSITMRTPGNDLELSLGFLFTEGIIENNSEIDRQVQVNENYVDVYLQQNHAVDLSKLDKHFYTSSSCGVCGKSSIEAIRTIRSNKVMNASFYVNTSVLFKLNSLVRNQQNVFQHTGGLHASALFDLDGNLLLIREDVGRHNALDKLIGKAFMDNHLPLNNTILFLSGRASFELLQKAIIAGIKFICALGAPSSLAVELAKEFDITLLGFLKTDSFNVYSAEHRII